MRALVLFGVLLSASQAASQEPPPPDKARIRQLIEKLGDNSFVAREAAQRELTQFAEYAVDELGEATISDDLERARRAKFILGSFDDAKLTHRIVDALDKPIKSARIVVKQGGETRSGFTDRFGRFSLPDPSKATANDIVVEVRHADYGMARWQSGLRIYPQTEFIDCKMPVVPRDSEARKRAVQGKVIDGHGKPVAGAVMHCASVRTQGEGLLTAESDSGDVVTDGEGQFALYLVANKPTRELKLRSELVPPGSRYRLTVTAADRDDCFPVDDMFANDGPLEIRLPLATRFHEFRFAQVGGGELADPKQLKNVIVEFYPKENDPNRVRLAPNDIEKGRKLIPGKYVATHYQNGKTINYLPLRVADDSPNILTFQLPSATVFRGKAVDGVTGKPVVRVWAAAINFILRGNLAELTGDDWQQMRAMPDVAGSKDAASKIFGTHYGVGALVRTDDEGRFEITEPPGIRFYNIMVFAENCLPITERVLETKRGPSGEVEIGNLPLFPAAKLQVKIISPEKGTAVMPVWKLQADDQPDWMARFQAVTADRSRQRFYQDYLVTLDTDYFVFIPSGVALRVEFRSNNERWGRATTEVVRAKQGEVIAAGSFRLPKTLPVAVLVVDPDGNPIEGLAVRSMITESKAWSLPYNTDSKGLAHLFVPPHSAGKIRVEWSRSQASPKDETLETAFQTRDAVPESPIEIRLTGDQIRLVPNVRANKK